MLTLSGDRCSSDEARAPYALVDEGIHHAKMGDEGPAIFPTTLSSARTSSTEAPAAPAPAAPAPAPVTRYPASSTTATHATKYRWNTINDAQDNTNTNTNTTTTTTTTNNNNNNNTNNNNSQGESRERATGDRSKQEQDVKTERLRALSWSQCVAYISTVPSALLTIVVVVADAVAWEP